MFESSRLIFYYTLSPVHAGAGSALGAIDNPIQREVHTSLPMFAGSGIKGAIRHACAGHWRESDEGQGFITRLFGPEGHERLHAGALSFSDAQLFLLPVRSLRGAFAYAASPLTLGRMARLAELAGTPVPWTIPVLEEGTAGTASDNLHSSGKLVLEAFEFDAVADPDTAAIAHWCSEHILPRDGAHGFFAHKVASDFVLIDDASLCHFGRSAMVVESHVRINDETGTADDGGLFFTENLPPETVMAGLVQASRERVPAKQGPREAAAVLDTLLDGPGSNGDGIAGKVLQVGGNSTTGRGLVMVNPVMEATS